MDGFVAVETRLSGRCLARDGSHKLFILNGSKHFACFNKDYNLIKPSWAIGGVNCLEITCCQG
jgi:hypothetical protein